MQLCLRPFYNNLRKPNIIEWTTEHQKRFEEIKTLSLIKYQIQSQIQTNHFMLCATPPIFESAQHYYNHTKKQTK